MKKDRCKHYGGYSDLSKGDGSDCNKGVIYRELVGGDDFGWVARLPCFLKHKTTIVCNHMKLPTEEEVKAHDKKIEDWLKKTLEGIKIIPHLKEKHPEGGSGKTECPICHKELRYSVSGYNQHVRLQCETGGCLSIIE